MRTKAFSKYAALSGGVVVAVAAVTVAAVVLTGSMRPVFISKVHGLKITSTVAQARDVGAVEAPANVVQEALGTPMNLGPTQVVGLQETESFYAGSVTAISAPDGTAFTSPFPESVWVVSVNAPGQDGWSQVTGTILIDAATGKVVAASMFGQN